MRYVDTSVIIAYLTPEVHSPAAQAFMLSAGEPLAISSWTEVE
jgi:predicted nucleic acid-binding protein